MSRSYYFTTYYFIPEQISVDLDLNSFMIRILL